MALESTVCDYRRSQKIQIVHDKPIGSRISSQFSLTPFSCIRKRLLNVNHVSVDRLQKP